MICSTILSSDAGQRQRARAPSQPRDQGLDLSCSMVGCVVSVSWMLCSEHVLGRLGYAMMFGRVGVLNAFLT